MKRVISLLVLVFLTLSIFVGCSSNKKSEEELRAEVKAEMEAEAKEKEKLKEKLKEEIKAEVEAEKNATGEVAQEEPTTVKENAEVKSPNKQINNSNQAEKSSNSLIEADKESGYFKYKANAVVNFDIDDDGTEEQIEYDTANGKLKVKGYEAVDIDTMFAEQDYFIIIKFQDKFDTEMNMIGIIDYGPSSDPTTALYSIIAPRGEKWFGSVGSVQGEIVPPAKYNEDNIDDFNYKAVLRKGQGIEAPVRLSMGIQTWFGRNLFTYYSTYTRLLDNKEKYEQDYITKSELMVEKDVQAYSEKDINSASVTIKAGQKVQLVATDNKEWIKMVANDATEGWVNVKDVTENNFSGFAFFD